MPAQFDWPGFDKQTQQGVLPAGHGLRRLRGYSLERICRAAGHCFILVPQALDKLRRQPGTLEHAHRRIEGMPWTDAVSRIGQNCTNLALPCHSHISLLACRGFQRPGRDAADAAEDGLDGPAVIGVREEDFAGTAGLGAVVPALEEGEMALADGGEGGAAGAESSARAASRRDSRRVRGILGGGCRLGGSAEIPSGAKAPSLGWPLSARVPSLPVCFLVFYSLVPYSLFPAFLP